MKRTVDNTFTLLPIMGEDGPLVDYVQDLRSLDDLVLPSRTRRAIDRVLAENRRAEELAARGLRAANRLLFCGPPGCGKTAAAGGLAAALGCPLATVRIDGVIGKFMGVSQSRLRTVFDRVNSQRMVVLLDEAEALGSARRAVDASAQGETNRIVSSVLTMLEGVRGPSLVIAATNHEGMLDPAIWRRFDEVVTFPRPSGTEGVDLLKRLLIKHGAVPAGFAFGDSGTPRPTLLARKLASSSFADVERMAFDISKSVVLGEASLGVGYALMDALERQRDRGALARPRGSK